RLQAMKKLPEAHSGTYQNSVIRRFDASGDFPILTPEIRGSREFRLNPRLELRSPSNDICFQELNKLFLDLDSNPFFDANESHHRDPGALAAVPVHGFFPQTPPRNRMREYGSHRWDNLNRG